MPKTTSSLVSRLSPAPGYLLVEPEATKKQTAAGVYLPDSHDEKPQQGKVLAVGATWTSDQGAKIDPPAKAGDTVIYKKWGGNDVKIDKIEYQFLKFEDILAVVSD